MKKTYRIINYFDVWGNERDGFEVNNQCYFGESIVLDSESSGAVFALELQNELKRVGYFASRVNRRLWSIDWNCSDGDYMELEQPNSRPICRIVLDTESEATK